MRGGRGWTRIVSDRIRREPASDSRWIGVSSDRSRLGARAASGYHRAMATRATPGEHLLPVLADAAGLKRYRDAVDELRRPPDEGSTEERVERARAAMSGLRLGAPLTPSHYR